MEVKLLDFVQECKWLARQALGKHAGEPASGGFARWKHVLLHCIRIEDEHSYRELIDRVGLMDTICDVLELELSPYLLWRVRARLGPADLGGLNFRYLLVQLVEFLLGHRL